MNDMAKGLQNASAGEGKTGEETAGEEEAVTRRFVRKSEVLRKGSLPPNPLNSTATVWDSYVAFIRVFTSSFMRRSLFVRLSVAVCGTLACWLLAAPADAATAARHHVRAFRCLCERPVAKRLRPRTFDRSAVRNASHYFVRAHRFVQRHPTEWLQRRPSTPLPGHDTAALQNSADALGEDDLLLLTALEPLGVLASPQDRITVNGAVAPRAPRGPPSPA